MNPWMIGALFAGWITGWWIFTSCKKPRFKKDAAIPLGQISLVVPARNEAHNLPALLASVKNISPSFFEILVVNDHSTDLTKRVAEEFGATVIDSAPLPPGWTGKTWACHQGALRAKAPWVLFLDADCWLETDHEQPLFASEGDMALSYLPFHRVKKYYEQLSVFHNMLMAAGVLLGRPKLFGQCLLMQRSTYLEKASHQHVSGHVLENLRLSENLRKQSVPVQSALGEKRVSMRMFPEGPSQMHRSWLKAFVSGANQVDAWAFALIIYWISCVSFAAYSSLFSASPAHWFFYALFGFQLAMLQRRFGNYSYAHAVLYPLPLSYFHAIFFLGVCRKIFKIPTLWKGRDVLPVAK